MRRSGSLLLVLVLLGWILSEIPIAPATSDAPSPVQWRRTRDGWEKQSWWNEDETVSSKPLHPAVVGTFQLLVSLGALLIWSSTTSKVPSYPEPTSAPNATMTPHRPRRSGRVAST